MQTSIVPIDPETRTNRKEVRSLTLTVHTLGIIVFVALFCGYGLAVTTPEESAGASTPKVVEAPKVP